MKTPRLTDDRRCYSKEEAINYALEQISVIKQGKEPLSPSMKEKRLAMEMYDKEAKEIEKLISKLPTNNQPINIKDKQSAFNPFQGHDLTDVGIGGKWRGD